MVSALMSVRPMAVSRPSMALRTQVGLPYLRWLRCVNNAIELSFEAQSIWAWLQYPLYQWVPRAQLCNPHQVHSTRILSQGTSVRGSALMSRPVTRSARCSRMVVRAAVSQTALQNQDRFVDLHACTPRNTGTVTLLSIYSGHSCSIGGREEDHC